MALVATLVANPSNPKPDAQRLPKRLPAVDASGLYWLADGVACDYAR
jgi:phosphoserine phosphatase